MLNDLYTIAITILQLAIYIGLAVFVLKLVFGFGLDRDGYVIASNRRGKFLARSWYRAKDAAMNATKSVFRGRRTHDNSVRVADMEGKPLSSTKESKGKKG